MIMYVNGSGTSLHKWKLISVTPLADGDLVLDWYEKGDIEGSIWVEDSWKNENRWFPQDVGLNNINDHLTVTTEVAALRKVEIEDQTKSYTISGDVPFMVELEPLDDYVEIEIELTNLTIPDDPQEFELEVSLYQKDMKPVWDDQGYINGFYNNIPSILGYPTERENKIKIYAPKDIIGFHLSVNNIHMSGTIRGLEQFEQLEAIKIKGSDYSDSIIKIEGKLPKSLKHIWLSKVEVDDIDTGANNLISLYASATKCEALTDILEKMPETMEYVFADPVKEFLPEGGQVIYYPWKFNLAGRVNLHPNLLFIGLYGASLNLEDLKALYELFKDVPEHENGVYLYFGVQTEEQNDYTINILGPMLDEKNITLSEY